MSFRKELRVIPRTAWIITGFSYVGMAILAWFLVPTDHEMSHWPLGGQFAFIFLMPLACLLIIPLYGYIYGDAKRRAMRYVMWTLLAIFVPDLIGVIIYFILRDALPVDCPSCHNLVPSKFTFARPAAMHCGHIVHSAESLWSARGRIAATVAQNFPDKSRARRELQRG